MLPAFHPPTPAAWLRPRAAPAMWFSIGLVVSVAAGAALVWLATLWPWLGLTLDDDASATQVRVTWVDPTGPSAVRVQAGDVLAAVEGSDGERTAITPALIARATYVLPSYAALDNFIEAHRRLHAALTRGPVQLLMADGRSVEITALQRRPPGSLPMDFWAPAALVVALLVMATGVLVYGERNAATTFFVVSGISYCGTLGTMALALGREVSFDGSWATAMWSVNQAARLTSHWALLMVFWVYPARWRPLRWSLPVAAVFMLAGIANELRWFPRPFVVAPLMSALTVLVGLPALCAWQWRASRGRPLERAIVKIMLLSFAAPAVLLIGLNQVPNMLWHRPLIESAAAIAGISTLTYAGCLVGIARHRLFNLDRWFFEGLVWAAGGVLVLLLDAAMVWLNVRSGAALGVALLAAGWLYFPLRQWLWRRLHPRAPQSLERHLPRLVDGLFRAESPAALADGWRTLIDDVYAPLRLNPVAASPATDQPRLEQNGQALRVPSLHDGQAFLLSHADKGRRLFGPDDVKLAAGLLALTRQAAAARQALDARAAERAARAHEKEAMLQDLHDGLGGLATNIRLLAAVGQRGPADALPQTLGTIAELADESLSEIRSFMYGLDDGDVDWPSVVADLRAFGRKLVEPHGPTFSFDADLAADAPSPDTLLRVNLARICKEALNNAVKHATARHVGIVLSVRRDGLQLQVHDDGIGMPAALRDPGTTSGRSRGLANLRRRAAQLGGALRFADGPGTTLQFDLPLPPKSPASGIAPGPSLA